MIIIFFLSEDGGAAARALIESMQLQAQLYEDWVEVMKDYSTVFCCADQEEEDSDGAKERSAEVTIQILPIAISIDSSYRYIKVAVTLCTFVLNLLDQRYLILFRMCSQSNYQIGFNYQVA